ncbi:MAG: thermonuclease family protein [Caulobacterales bacterium]
MVGARRYPSQRGAHYCARCDDARIGVFVFLVFASAGALVLFRDEISVVLSLRDAAIALAVVLFIFGSQFIGFRRLWRWLRRSNREPQHAPAAPQSQSSHDVRRATEPERRKTESVFAPHEIKRPRVIDGDTLDDSDTGIRYRIENIDAPETGDNARCASERRLGELATIEARTIIAKARIVFAKPTGRVDPYGRVIAFIRVDDRDFGEEMIARGFARPWRGHREPWCDDAGRLIWR